MQLKKSNIVVLGNFDGLHRGHQQLFECAKVEAKKQTPEAEVIGLSFFPPPSWVLAQNPKQLLTSSEEKRDRLIQIGINKFIEYPFNNIVAKMSPEEFFRGVLLEQLNAKTIVIGNNYYFGKNKVGNASYMEQLGKKYNVNICIVKDIKDNNTIISSTQIRALIAQGKMLEAQTLLGYPYMITGEIVHGRALGKTIGFPTANISANLYKVYPPNGVYATKFKVKNKLYTSITNVGNNPTVKGVEKTVETNIFNFNENIYGEIATVYFFDYLRPEKRFDGLDELIKQISIDKEKVKILSYSSPL
ncbi:riboflavin biosynthesis protein RibF [Candidatus Epulonipiscium fishelsonii]|uniref:Riboflavin biosynthesis protein RibF n=1 Tax=Candidatus Epulonipiscium fishelsonii TaxID=77094 RepID=A0ACC8XFQ2_9FIRM|nr:riboflavin biosynthesis protein RibF [Epulopiscium sp. SCG-B11WGA-EpuloA1]ONI42864.1 riboflavin biosynthesis protein RibF [Epulopiscium sp. SCG-B05WGA-EpuloA1]